MAEPVVVGPAVEPEAAARVVVGEFAVLGKAVPERLRVPEKDIRALESYLPSQEELPDPGLGPVR